MRWRHVCAAIAWIIAAVFVAAALSRVVPVVRDHLAAPFDLGSEGPHMSTVKALEHGDDIYDPRSFLDLPFHMTPYMPLYHAIAAALPQRAENPFFTGRVVAAIAMIAAAASLAFVAGRRDLPTALIAIAAFFLIHSTTDNTAYVRSDALALCFSAWAVALVMRARTHHAAAACGALCALGFVAKQSYVAVSVACFLYLVATDVRRASWLVLGGVATGAACAAAASAYWGNGFWLAVTIPMTDYPRDMEACFLHWRMMMAQPVFRAIGGIAIAATAASLVEWRRAARAADDAHPRAYTSRVAIASSFLPYALIAWAAGGWVSTGVGAGNHDLLEPVLATLLWIVFVARQRRSTVLDWPWVLAVTVLALAVAREMRNPDRGSYSETDAAATARYLDRRERATAAMRALGVEHGLKLNLKNSQIAHDFENVAVNDVWMYIQVLWNTRPETTDRLVRAIEDERFDAILTSPGVVTAARDRPDTPWGRIVHAVFTHYGVAYHGEQVNVLTRLRDRARPRSG